MIPFFRHGAVTVAGGADIPYVIVASGPTPIVILPGAGDGSTAVGNAALRLAVYYRRRHRQFRLLVLGR